MSVERQEYEVHIAVRVPCEAKGCRKIVTSYARKAGGSDRRVWCLAHAHLARQAETGTSRRLDEW